MVEFIQKAEECYQDVKVNLLRAGMKGIYAKIGFQQHKTLLEPYFCD